METARECRLPVTVLMGVREDDGKYLDRDKIMQVAYTRYLKTICPGCGLPAHRAHGDDNAGRFEIDSDTICHGCVAIESYTADKTRDKYPGQKLMLRDTHLE